MKKSPFVRIQLLLLGGVTLLLFVRVITGPPGRSGLVVVENVEAESLYRRSLDVDRRIRVSIEGMGAFENEERAALAAYGWILNRATREVVWTMDASSNARAGRGLIAEVEDEITLDGGQYEVFFASYGSRLDNSHSRSFLDLFTEGRDWRKEARRWYLVLTLLEGKETDARLVSRDDNEAALAPDETLLWSSNPVSSHSTAQFLFEVKQNTTVKIRSAGEIAGDMHDFGKLENVLTHETVWQLTPENSTFAGGVEQNRVSRAEVRLAPGIYLASYRTDASHAYRDWQGNPPYDPFNWGLTITGAEAAGMVTPFDPWNGNSPVIALTSVRNSEFEATTFTVTQPQQVMVYSLGEMKRNDRYDFGWIERGPALEPAPGEDLRDISPNSSATIWEMRYEESENAGGSETNRRSIDFLDLQPGTYTAYYRTDDSHAYGDWRNGEPMQSDRWGLAVFALQQNGASAINVLQRIEIDENEWENAADALPPAPPAPPMRAAPPVSLPVDQDQILVAMSRLGNNADRHESFVIDDAMPLRIIAAGEISPNGNRYDYGTIERADDGTIVWEMTWDNTQPGGGDEGNRLFDGLVELAPGEYVVRFQTDGTHSFEQFDGGPPALADAWGITVARTR